MEAEAHPSREFKLLIDDKDLDWDTLAAATVQGGEKTPLIGRRAELSAHLEELSREFVGEPQLYLYHAVLIVHIRREVQRDKATRQFHAMWRAKTDQLLKGLSSRWLVSACDTIMDCSPDPYEQAIACAASTLVNTVKLYETERLGTNGREIAHECMSVPVPLFDGLTSFAVGRGDMIWNLRQRGKAICRHDSLAARIFQELTKRIDRHDTVYRRLLQSHVNEGTRWD